jgi:multidrug transporter EmrE-like cation transporter
MNLLEKVREYAKNSVVDEIIILAMFVAIIETIAQNSLKYSDTGSFIFIIGLCFYILVGYFLHYAYHNVPLGRLNVTWSCISIILAMSLGYFFYDEPINRYSMLSLVFAILAIYCANKSAEL